ncbi:ATP-binding protein [Streptococcus infantis]|uniref:ATP-binding protein n=1 Tax=Streptococcus infantis TaxID=68892 RepID=UPI0039E11982
MPLAEIKKDIAGTILKTHTSIITGATGHGKSFLAQDYLFSVAYKMSKHSILDPKRELRKSYHEVS